MSENNFIYTNHDYRLFLQKGNSLTQIFIFIKKVFFIMMITQ